MVPFSVISTQPLQWHTPESTCVRSLEQIDETWAINTHFKLVKAPLVVDTYIWFSCIPGSSKYEKYLPFAKLFGWISAHILHTWKIQVWTTWCRTTHQISDEHPQNTYSLAVKSASRLYNTTSTWNPNDLYFWRPTPQNKAFSNQNKGHLGSRYIYIYGFFQNVYISPPLALKLPWSLLVTEKNHD